MKLNKISETAIKVSLFWMLVIYFGISLYLMLKVHPNNETKWKDMYQVEKQRSEQCNRNFEEITPQLDQKIIHLYPYEVQDEELELQDGVVK